MVKFTHYLVTRFNVPVENWGTDKSGQITLDDVWLKHRIELFLRYCVPTVAAQSEKNFTWLIYCDTDTNADVRLTIENSIQSIPTASIRFASTFNQLLVDLKEVMFNTASTFLITSRLDNDDGLGKNYIKYVQAHFREADNLLLNLGSGIVFDVNENVLTQIRLAPNNHYTSLVEKRKNADTLLTVFGFPHDNPPGYLQIINIPAAYAWLKIIHERNVKSRLKGRPILKFNSDAFEVIDKKYFTISIFNTLRYILTRSLEKIKRNN